jgi:hypothetical protein
MIRHASRISARRTFELLRLVSVALLVGAHSAAAATCLTPEVGRVLSDLVAAGALQRALGDDLRLTGGNVGGNQIQLDIEDRAQRAYALVLAIPASRNGLPDGAGRRFAYYLDASPQPPQPAARAALLAAAAIVDAAVPDTALQPCSQPETDAAPKAPPAADSAVEPGMTSTSPNPPPSAHRVPRAFALAGAVAQLAALAAAIFFGVRVVGSPPATAPRSDEDAAA